MFLMSEVPLHPQAALPPEASQRAILWTLLVGRRSILSHAEFVLVQLVTDSVCLSLSLSLSHPPHLSRTLATGNARSPLTARSRLCVASTFPGLPSRNVEHSRPLAMVRGVEYAEQSFSLGVVEVTLPCGRDRRPESFGMLYTYI